MIITQIIIILIDVIFIWKNKDTKITQSAKAVVYFIKGDFVSCAYMLTDIGQEIAFEMREYLPKRHVILVIEGCILFAFSTFNFYPLHVLVLLGILSATYFSFSKNHKSSFSHLTWLTYNVITRNYILAIDEALYIIKRFYEELLISQQEIEEEQLESGKHEKNN